MMIELLVMLLRGTSCLQSLTTSFRVVRLMVFNPLFLYFLVLAIGLKADDYLELGWNFPIILMEFVTLIVVSFFIGYWLGVALNGL